MLTCYAYQTTSMKGTITCACANAKLLSTGCSRGRSHLKMNSLYSPSIYDSQALFPKYCSSRHSLAVHCSIALKLKLNSLVLFGHRCSANLSGMRSTDQIYWAVRNVDLVLQKFVLLTKQLDMLEICNFGRHRVQMLRHTAQPVNSNRSLGKERPERSNPDPV